MKANQFLRNDDDAVSPVIAVILMVAITVVLAATVYVWVSGFGSGTTGAPAHTLSLTSAGTVTGYDTAASAPGVDYYTKKYTVASADPTLTYGDMKVTVGGTQFTHSTTAGDCAATQDTLGANEWVACQATGDARAATESVSAGDTFILRCDSATDCLSDKDFLILDVEANSIMVNLKVR